MFVSLVSILSFNIYKGYGYGGDELSLIGIISIPIAFIPLESEAFCEMNGKREKERKKGR